MGNITMLRLGLPLIATAVMLSIMIRVEPLTWLSAGTDEIPFPLLLLIMAGIAMWLVDRDAR